MRYLDDDDNQFVIEYFVDDAINTLSNSVTFLARKLDTAICTWVKGKAIYTQ